MRRMPEATRRAQRDQRAMAAPMTVAMMWVELESGMVLGRVRDRGGQREVENSREMGAMGTDRGAEGGGARVV